MLLAIIFDKNLLQLCLNDNEIRNVLLKSKEFKRMFHKLLPEHNLELYKKISAKYGNQLSNKSLIGSFLSTFKKGNNPLARPSILFRGAKKAVKR